MKNAWETLPIDRKFHQVLGNLYVNSSSLLTAMFQQMLGLNLNIYRFSHWKTDTTVIMLALLLLLILAKRMK